MKKVKDMALEYMLELGISPAKSNSGFITQITKTCGKETADRIAALIHERGEGKAEGKDWDNKFYTVKNADLKTSIAVTGGFDGDIVRKTCDWIIKHKDAFGKHILDIGCDNGIVSCFIARVLPEAEVTAIDRCEASISIAKALAEKLKVNNIQFRYVSDLCEVKEQYDTVFSSRTMHENLDKENLIEDYTRLLREQGKSYMKATEAYAKMMVSLVADDGNFISIERTGRNPLYLGWLLALNAYGLVSKPEWYSELECRELEVTDSVFQATVAKKQEPENEEEIYGIFCYSFLKKINLTLAQYHGWDAAVMLQNSLNDLIEGYRIYEKNGKCIAKVALWTSEEDKDSILAEQHLLSTGFHCLSNCYAHTLESCKESVRETVNGALAVGQIVMKLKYEDGCETEVDRITSIS